MWISGSGILSCGFWGKSGPGSLGIRALSSGFGMGFGVSGFRFSGFRLRVSGCIRVEGLGVGGCPKLRGWGLGFVLHRQEGFK